MYSASQYEFRSFPDIRRNSPPPTLRTEDAPTRWLNGERDLWQSVVKTESSASVVFSFFTTVRSNKKELSAPESWTCYEYFSLKDVIQCSVKFSYEAVQTRDLQTVFFGGGFSRACCHDTAFLMLHDEFLI